MENLKQNEVIKITKFFQRFANSSAKILYGYLDKDTYKDISIDVKSIHTVDSIVEYKKNNLFLVVDYAKESKQSSLGLLLPEELIAEMADVIMGGNGENCYNGSLTELQLNSIKDLFSKILKEFEAIFKAIFNKILAFSTDIKLLTKEMPEYNQEFDKNKFNFVLEEEVKFNENKSYSFCLLLNFYDVKEILTDLDVLNGKENHKVLSGEAIGIDLLKDVKINITAELGHKEVPVKYALELVRGSIVELDTLTNQDIRVYANGVEVALAQVVAVEENFGLKITKILSPEERMRSI